MIHDSVMKHVFIKFANNANAHKSIAMSLCPTTVLPLLHTISLAANLPLFPLNCGALPS